MCLPCLYSEFNHQRNEEGECVLVKGVTRLPSNRMCLSDQDYWYERTAYRKLPYSTCEYGVRPDRGARHPCPKLREHNFWFQPAVLIIPFAFIAVIAYYYYGQSGMARGYVRYVFSIHVLIGSSNIQLPDPGESFGKPASTTLDTLGSYRSRRRSVGVC